MTDALDAAERTLYARILVYRDHNHEYGVCDGGPTAWSKCPEEPRLLAAIRDLRREAYQQGLRDGRNPSVDEALNSGDGSYRP